MENTKALVDEKHRVHDSQTSSVAADKLCPAGHLAQAKSARHVKQYQIGVTSCTQAEHTGNQAQSPEHPQIPLRDLKEDTERSHFGRYSKTGKDTCLNDAPSLNPIAVA